MTRVVHTTKPWTVDIMSPIKDDVKLQKGIEFLNAFAKGFEIIDRVSVIRMDIFYIRTLHIKDVKRTMKGDHLTRTVGRICEANGVMHKKLEKHH